MEISCHFTASLTLKGDIRLCFRWNYLLFFFIVFLLSSLFVTSLYIPYPYLSIYFLIFFLFYLFYLFFCFVQIFQMIIMSKFYKLSDFYPKELLKYQKCLRPGTHPCPMHIYTKKYAASKRHSAFFTIFQKTIHCVSQPEDLTSSPFWTGKNLLPYLSQPQTRLPPLQATAEYKTTRTYCRSPLLSCL